MAVARSTPKRDWTGILLPIGGAFIIQILGWVWLASAQTTRLLVLEEKVTKIEAASSQYVMRGDTERESSRIEKHLERIDDKLDQIMEKK